MRAFSHHRVAGWLVNGPGAKAMTHGASVLTLRYRGPVILLALLLVVGCSRNSAVVGCTYRALDGGKAVTILSPTELEFAAGGVPIGCTYTRKGQILRVVSKGLGATLAQHFTITSEGLLAGDGAILYEPTAYRKAMDEVVALEWDAEHPQMGMDLRYQIVKGKVLGGYLTQEFPGKRAVIVLPPEMPVTSSRFRGVLAGLEKAMTGIVIVGKVEPKMPLEVWAKLARTMASDHAGAMKPEGTTWFRAAQLDAELHPYQGQYDLLVFLTAIPDTEPVGTRDTMFAPYKEMECWADEKVKVVIAEGAISRLGDDIASGKICAAVAYRQLNPYGEPETQPPTDQRGAFNTRFVLITPKNIQEYKSYFAK